MNIRDEQILEHMVQYCEEILDALQRFNNSKEKFMGDYLFYNLNSATFYSIQRALS